MKLFVDLTTRRFVKSAASSAALPTLVLKRRDLLPIEVIFVQRGAPVAAPSGTVTKVALKQSFGDSNFLAVADSGYLDLYTAGVEALLPGDTSKADALLEVRYAHTGEATRTATLQVEIQNSVILGTEGTPAAAIDYKATQADAEAGTDNDRWMTPLRTAQAILKLAATSWNSITGKPSTFPPDSHQHTASQITDFSSAVAAIAPTDYATSAQGAKADTALQPSALTPYRTSAAQDLIDAGKAAASHDHDGRYYTETEMDTLLAGKQPTGSYATAAQGAKADSALQSGALTPYRTSADQDTIDAGKVSTTDSRLSDSRTPTAHKSTHATGGADAIAPSDIGAATAVQGTKADTALQPSALTPYRTSAAQDLIDAGKAATSHDHDGRYYTETEMDTLLAGKQPTGSYATAAQGAKADSALQSGTAIANISGLQTALDGKQAAGSYAPATGISPTAITGTAVVDSDARLTNSRQPTSHKSSHATGGADALTPADIGAAASSHQHALGDLLPSGATANQVPVWNGTAWVPQTTSATGGAAVQVFLASGPWTKPAGAKKVEVQIVGGGGGGGSGRKGAVNSVRSGGGGGAGAGTSIVSIDASTLPNAPTTVAVVIGAGGLGGASQATNSTNGLIGADGGDSTFGIFRGRGGSGGNGGTATTATGGAGGSGQFIGSTGGTGGGSTASTNAAGGTFVSGGGGGGGISAANALVNASNGGAINSTNLNGAGTNTSPTPHGLITALGQGSGGGSASLTANGNSGPLAGLYGGGGGGGGASTDTAGNSGAGGKGGDGVVIVTTYF